MKKLLTMGILGAITLVGFSASALADECVTQAAPTTYYQAPVNVGPVYTQPVYAQRYQQSWRGRRAAELRRIEEQRQLEEARRQAEIQAQLQARRAQHARRAELARLERSRAQQVRFGRIAHHRFGR